MAYLSKYVFDRARRGGVVRVPPEGARCSAKGLAGMRHWGRAGTPTTAVLLLAVLAACTPRTEASPSATPSSPTVTTSPATPTASPSPTTDSEIAARSAEDLIHEYYRVIDGLGSDPDAPIATLKDVAISKDLSVWQRQIERDRRDGHVQTGETQVAQVEVQSVNLDNSEPSAGHVPTVQIDVCYDVSAVDIRGEEGDSIVSPERPDTGWVRHTVSNYSWDTEPRTGWRVSTSVDLEQAPCDTTD